MRIRRLAIAGVALAAALGMSGCGPTSTNNSGTGGAPAAVESSAPADPGAELAAAAAKVSGQSLKVKMSMSGAFEGDGQVAENGDIDMTMNIGEGDESMSFETRKVGDDMYMKFGGELGALLGGGKWMHLDASKMPAGSALSSEANDPAQQAKLLQESTTVEKVGERSYKGTLDMTKSPTADEETLKELGDKATAVPFTAEVDEQGRLSEMVIDMASIAPAAGKMTVSYYDYGAPVEVKAPAKSEVKEMDEKMLEMFNS